MFFRYFVIRLIPEIPFKCPSSGIVRKTISGLVTHVTHQELYVSMDGEYGNGLNLEKTGHFFQNWRRPQKVPKIKHELLFVQQKDFISFQWAVSNVVSVS